MTKSLFFPIKIKPACIKNYTINKQKIAVCFEQILLSPIPHSRKTEQQCVNFVNAINYINEYPDVNATATITRELELLIV